VNNPIDDSDVTMWVLETVENVCDMRNGARSVWTKRDKLNSNPMGNVMYGTASTVAKRKKNIRGVI